jgi:hypothetical protein
MSVTLASFESVLDMVKRFYDPNLPVIYSTRHIEILLDMIGFVIHERQFPVICTTIPLAEPIYAVDNTIIVSRPLLAYYINQPVQMPQMNVEFVKNVDIFADIIPSLTNKTKTDDDDDDDDNDNSGDTVSYPLYAIANNKDDGVYHRSTRRLVNDRGGCPRFEQDMLGKRFSEEENVRFAHTVKLVLLVAHWEQHYKRHIPYTNHTNFHNIDIGNQKMFYK